MKKLLTALVLILFACNTSKAALSTNLVYLGAAPNDGTGDNLRLAMSKINTNLAGIGSALSNTFLATGGLAVTNDTTILGNHSVAGTSSYGTVNATNFNIINPWDGRLVTNTLIGTWQTGIYGTLPATAVAQAPGVSAPTAGHAAASSQTNIAFNLFRSPISCYLSNFCVGLNNGSGVTQVGTNYLVSIVTNGVVASQSRSILTNGVATATAFSYVTNTSFSIPVGVGTTVAFYLQNTNAAHTPAAQALHWSVGVYSR